MSQVKSVIWVAKITKVQSAFACVAYAGAFGSSCTTKIAAAQSKIKARILLKVTM
jgi:hypothetical protein